MEVEGGEIIVRTVVPAVKDESQTFPVLVHIHGGGMCKVLQCFVAYDSHSSHLGTTGRCVGSIELDDYFLRKLSVDLTLSTVNVEYR